MGLMEKSVGHGLQAQRYAKNAGREALHVCSYELHLSMLMFYIFLLASARHRIQILTTDGQLSKEISANYKMIFCAKSFFNTHWEET